MKARVLLGSLVLLLAGCLGFGDDRPDYDGIETDANLAAAPLLNQEHEGVPDGHFKAALHAGAFNLESAAYHNGFDDSGDADAIPAGGYYTELAVTPRYAYLARASADGGYGGFVILSLLKDADGVPHPAKVGEFAGMTGADIEISDDEKLAFFATQRNTVEQIAGGLSVQQDPMALLPRGIAVVNIADKTNPTLAGFFPVPYNGPHTVTYFRHDNGNEYVIATTYDLASSSVPSSSVPPLPVPFTTNPATQRVLVLQVQRNPQGPGAALTPVSEFQILESGSNGKVFFPHDTVVEKRDNRTLLYVAYWDKGVQILDFTDPAAVPLPVVGSFTEFSPSSLTAIHRTGPFGELIDGFHVTVAEPEIVSAPDETGYITFLDTTTPERIEKLGDWTLPPGSAGVLGVQDLNFSPHNFDTWDGKVALAHNHAGLWVIDVSDEENLKDPKTVGFYMDVPERQDMTREQPRFWGVFEQDGYLYAADEGTGLHVLRYTGP